MSAEANRLYKPFDVLALPIQPRPSSPPLKAIFGERLSLTDLGVVELTEPWQNASKSCLYDVETFIRTKWPEQEMILDPWLAKGTSHMVYADAGVGKTFMILSVIQAILTNTPIGPWKPKEATGILYIDGEMCAGDLTNRLKGLSASLPPRLAPLLIWSSHALALHGQNPINISDTKWQEVIFDVLQERKDVRLIVLDNLSCLSYGIDQNDQKEWDRISPWIIRLKHLGCAVIFLHHAGKKGDQRGTSARRDAVDTVIELKNETRRKPENGVDCTVSFTKVRNFAGAKAGSFRFKLSWDQNTGTIAWTTDSTQLGKEGDRKRARIIDLLGQGIKQVDIAASVTCNKSYVTRIKAKALEDGYLREVDGRLQLTPEGQDFVDQQRTL